MKIIIGLGNPGKKYEQTRHNVGFMLLDRLGRKEQLVFKKSFKSQSFLARKRFGEEVVFVKPRTFMNNSGLTAAWFCKTYKIPAENFLVVYDDMDLDLGRLKFSAKGSSAGHRGMESIIRALQTDRVSRLRIGISKTTGDAVDYVLADFSEEEGQIIDKVLENAVSACRQWLSAGIEDVMRRYNVKKERKNGENLRVDDNSEA